MKFLAANWERSQNAMALQKILEEVISQEEMFITRSP
jgi:hypothetical protein